MGGVFLHADETFRSLVPSMNFYQSEKTGITVISHCETNCINDRITSVSESRQSNPSRFRHKFALRRMSNYFKITIKRHFYRFWINFDI